MNHFELYKDFSQFLCELLDLKLPDFCLVRYEKHNIVLYDKDLKIISYDERDIGRKVEDVLFIPHQNIIYINEKSSQHPTNTLILISKRLRFMYQLKQRWLYQSGEFVEVNKRIIEGWIHEFNPSKLQERMAGNLISPAELDRKAFSQIIMRIVFHINVNYNVETGLKDNERVYEGYLRDVEGVYSTLFIGVVFNKYRKKLRIR